LDKLKRNVQKKTPVIPEEGDGFVRPRKRGGKQQKRRHLCKRSKKSNPRGSFKSGVGGFLHLTASGETREGSIPSKIGNGGKNQLNGRGGVVVLGGMGKDHPKTV